MADWSQFEWDDTAGCGGEIPAGCQVCEAMLPDAVDGTLSEAEQRAFDRHVAGCVVCARELEEAQRGAAWLGLLKQQSPVPSAPLLDRILAQTSGAVASNVQTGAVAVHAALPAEKAAPAPAWIPQPDAPRLSATFATRREVRVATAWQTITGSFTLDWLRPMLQPRMAMTAAMAFFSVALTLNLTGVRLNTVSAASLRPSVLRRTVTDRSAAVVRSFQNMPVVYQTEARMSDLRSDWQQGEERPARREETPGAGSQKPRQPDERESEKTPEKGQGSSRLELSPVDPRTAGMTRKGA